MRDNARGLNMILFSGFVKSLVTALSDDRVPCLFLAVNSFYLYYEDDETSYISSSESDGVILSDSVKPL